jgi:hypothetical protein
VSNRTIHTDLRIPYIEEVIKEHSNAHFKKTSEPSQPANQASTPPARRPNLLGTLQWR